MLISITAQIVICADELRDLEGKNIRYTGSLQPLVNHSLAEIRFGFAVYFHGGPPTSRLAFSHEDRTVNSEAESLSELHLMLRRVSHRILNEEFVQV